jgi:hypothetical protein
VITQKDRKYYVAVEGKKYSVLLHPDTRDRGYWIECPSLPGLRICGAIRPLVCKG